MSERRHMGSGVLLNDTFSGEDPITSDTICVGRGDAALAVCVFSTHAGSVGVEVKRPSGEFAALDTVTITADEVEIIEIAGTGNDYRFVFTPAAGGADETLEIWAAGTGG